ncbi:phosphatase methylesterase 1 [Gossypium arboreum]|uniref:Phosphatase methylesterase 1 n=1 Tax=Gossypium arboreum TaxID=29729 RepID=A0A0B0N986_GOSAR|nr:phosphatase methylesterase 1 [Gossypium arboreum]
MAHGLAHGRVNWPLQFWHSLIHQRVVGRVTQVSNLSSFQLAWHTGVSSTV